MHGQGIFTNLLLMHASCGRPLNQKGEAVSLRGERLVIQIDEAVQVNTLLSSCGCHLASSLHKGKGKGFRRGALCIALNNRRFLDSPAGHSYGNVVEVAQNRRFNRVKVQEGVMDVLHQE